MWCFFDVAVEKALEQLTRANHTVYLYFYTVNMVLACRDDDQGEHHYGA